MLTLRPFEPSDKAYVVSTWLSSFQATALTHEFKTYTPTHYRYVHNARIDAALAEGEKITIASDDVAPDLIIGWMATKGATLDYIYVRASLRGKGIATALLATVPNLKWYSHATAHWLRLKYHKFPNLKPAPKHFTRYSSLPEVLHGS